MIDFELTQRAPVALTIVAAMAAALLLIGAIATGILAVLSLVELRAEGLVAAVITSALAALALRFIRISRVQWQLRGQITYVVRCRDGRLSWGETGDEQSVGLEDIVAVEWVAAAGDGSGTWIRLADGNEIAIRRVPFERHTELVALLERAIRARTVRS
jgi:hypothetical protein